MSFSSEKTTSKRGRLSSSGADVDVASSNVQLKRELGGLSYEEQRARLQPNSNSPIQMRSDQAASATSGRAGGFAAIGRFFNRMRGPGEKPNETVESVDVNLAEQVSGPIGRLFNRICGVDENQTDPAGLSFGDTELQQYLKEELQMAKGEMFRGAKLKGISKKLIGDLDKDGDGRLNWDEFKAFEGQVLERLAPGPDISASASEMEGAASSRYDQLDGGDGALGYGELKQGAKDQLPADTKHLSLIAQLAARITLDALDTDERDKPVAERTLSRDEYLDGTREITKRQKSMG